MTASGESYYNYYRDYDPSIGRYIQADPRGILMDFNDPQRQVATTMGIPTMNGDSIAVLNHIYGYANSNPLIYYDPTGEYWGIAASLIGAAIVGGSVYMFQDCNSKCAAEGCEENQSPAQKQQECYEKCKPYLLFIGWTSRAGLAGKAGSNIGQEVGGALSD